VDGADLSELRAGTDKAGDLWLLARTTTMTTPTTALLVLLDTTSGGQPRPVGFGSGINSTRAEEALLLIGNRGWVEDIASGAVTELPAGSVATNPGSYVNAIEARIGPAATGGRLSQDAAIAAATGVADPRAGRS